VAGRFCFYGSLERLFFIDVVSFHWNCPKYITPRYTAEELQELVAPLQARRTGSKTEKLEL
jgi:hypothetical protein